MTSPAAARRVAAAAFVALLGAGLPQALLAARLEVAVLDGEGRPLADAVVYLDSPAARAAVRPLAGVEIVQAGERFTPEVTVVPLGTEVAFPNRDAVHHHVYSFSAAKSFEILLHPGAPVRRVRFDRPGVAALGCNIGDRMLAWVVVVATPWHARTDDRGRARLEAPAGAYRLRAWHPALPPGAAAGEQALRLGADGARARIALAAGP